jgi:hypothetical protein
MIKFAKFFAHVVSNQLSLDLCDQITVIIVDYESNRTVAPFGCTIELGKPLTMFFVLGVEHNPLSSV